MHIIQFEYGISKVDVLEQFDQVTDVKLQGGGGTCIKEVIDWGIKNNPAVMLIMTDGWVTPYEPEINFPLVWVIVGNSDFTSNIGRVIHYTED